MESQIRGTFLESRIAQGVKKEKAAARGRAKTSAQALRD